MRRQDAIPEADDVVSICHLGRSTNANAQQLLSGNYHAALRPRSVFPG